MHAIDIAQQLCCLVSGQNADPMSQMSAAFQDTAEISLAQVLACVGLAAAVALLLWRVARRMAQQEGHSYCHAQRLFQELCRTHELDWPSRRLLRRLAVARDATHPARVFVEPGWFQTAEIPAPLHPYRQELETIRKRLFD